MSSDNISYALGAFPVLELLSHKPKSVTKIILSSKAEPELINKFQNYSHLFVTNDRLISRLSKAKNIYVIGEFVEYPTHLDSTQPHLVLDQVSDMGNLGTIIRTMVGFGFKNLVMINPSADIFHPKVVRASMGAVFQINFSYYESFAGYSAAYPRNYYSFISDAASFLQNISFQSPYSLIFGNESAGLPDSYRQIGTPVRIPQTQNIDSLNLSVAAALDLYHAYIRNQ